jgi:hypothetical protein
VGHGDVDRHAGLHGSCRGWLQSRGRKGRTATAQGLIGQRSGGGDRLALAVLPS